MGVEVIEHQANEFGVGIDHIEQPMPRDQSTGLGCRLYFVY